MSPLKPEALATRSDRLNLASGGAGNSRYARLY